jgi:hypothetical protein
VASANSLESHEVKPLSLISDYLAAGAGSSLLSTDAIAGPNPVLASLPDLGSASGNGWWNATWQANTAGLEVALRQWLMSQQTLASAAPVADVPSFPTGMEADPQLDASLWNDPFAALILGF